MNRRLHPTRNFIVWKAACDAHVNNATQACRQLEVAKDLTAVPDYIGKQLPDLRLEEGKTKSRDS